MKKCPDFFKTKRICLKAGVSMGTGFSSTEEFVWKRLAACHGAEERETHAHYCAPFYCLLFCCGVLFFFSCCSVLSFLAPPPWALAFLTPLTLCLSSPSSALSSLPLVPRDEPAAPCLCQGCCGDPAGSRSLEPLTEQTEAALILPAINYTIELVNQ